MQVVNHQIIEGSAVARSLDVRKMALTEYCDRKRF